MMMMVMIMLWPGAALAEREVVGSVKDYREKEGHG